MRACKPPIHPNGPEESCRIRTESFRFPFGAERAAGGFNRSRTAVRPPRHFKRTDFMVIRVSPAESWWTKIAQNRQSDRVQTRKFPANQLLDAALRPRRTGSGGS